jgi:pyruvate-ferredoxin/flavodoxin oxidoreductase
VNHLFQDAPSIAIGIFEGHMRKMVDGMVEVRRAEKLVDGSYDAEADEAALDALDWKGLTDEEFKLCPPILTIGGDGAMLDIGFQNLSRLMASGKPIRVLVLDTQVYSNTGGQACTSGFTGQIADMSAWGKAQHGKEEVRKELAYIAMAHRGVFVHQSSQALASHLMEGVIKGLNSRRPAIFNIYTPCPVEHGLADDWAPEAAKLALESRAFPYLTYDPDAGRDVADCLSLAGNPAMDATWPTYTLAYLDDEGAEQSMELPLTIADWAYTEARFRKHFSRGGAADDDLVPFHEFLDLDAAAREGNRAFIWTLGADRRRARVVVSREIVLLAEERLLFWHQMRELAGLDVPDSVRETLADAHEVHFDAAMASLRAEYEKKLADLRDSFPAAVARRMAKGLLAHGGGRRTVAELLEQAMASPLPPVTRDDVAGLDVGGSAPLTNGAAGAGDGTAASRGGDAAPAADTQGAAEPAGATAVGGDAEAVATASAAGTDEDDDGLALEPYIDTAMCTSCNECTNINGQMFAYDGNKQAYIKDPRAGTFAQLVQAAEKCPAAIIHPGTPLNPKEKDLEKWVKRAEKFN